MKPLQDMTTKSLQARYRRVRRRLRSRWWLFGPSLTTSMQLHAHRYALRRELERRGATVPKLKE